MTKVVNIEFSKKEIIQRAKVRDIKKLVTK